MNCYPLLFSRRVGAAWLVILTLCAAPIARAEWPTWPTVPEAERLVFPLDPDRLARPHFTTEVWLQHADFARLAEGLAEDPRLRTAWDSYLAKARALLAAGHWPEQATTKEERYTYFVRGWLPRFALVYAATGQADLGRLVRTLTLDLVRRPLDFWIHSALRPLDRARPVGGLETAELTRGIALTLAWTGELFTPEETAEIRAALRDKGLIPCLRFLENPERPRNNWIATVSAGARIGAIVLNDADAEAAAVKGLNAWLDFVESDGSYGEPVGYFQFGAEQFFYGWWARGWTKARESLHDRSLAHSAAWMVMHYVARPVNGHRTPLHINWGDDDLFEAPNEFVCASLAYAYDDGIAAWLGDYFHQPDRPPYLMDFLLRLGAPGRQQIAAVSPSERGLPTAKVFANGVALFRTGWTMERDVVLSLRSGGAARTGYAHDRGNRNAIMLLADGDSWVAAPGRASYRNPVRKTWDILTSSHSVVTFGKQEQSAKPVAVPGPLVEHGDWVGLASDAAAAYGLPVASARRQVWFNQRTGWVVLEDTNKLSSAQFMNWRLLLANEDGASKIAKLDDNRWRFERPSGRMLLSAVADTKLSDKSRLGIMHRGYSYFAGGPNEGQPGSAVQLVLTSRKPKATFHTWTLLLPRAGATETVTSESVGEATRWRVTRAGQTQLLTAQPGQPPTLTGVP